MHRTRLNGYARGFTLIELMVTIAIVAILAAIAFPSFQSSLRSNRVATATNEMMASFALARSEAVRSARGSGICATVNGTSCGGTWGDGWIVWVDSNGDQALSAGEPIVRYTQARSKTTITGTATTVAFDSRGRVIGGEQKIDVSPTDAAEPARCLAMNATGQINVLQAVCS